MAFANNTGARLNSTNLNSRQTRPQTKPFQAIRPHGRIQRPSGIMRPWPWK